METINQYIEKNKQRFIDELFKFIELPSVSSKKDNKDIMYKTAAHVADSLLKAGADKAEIHDTDGWPVVFGQKIVNEKLPTVLVYGHYDVQPAEPLELWESPPFKPEIRNEKIYARGADDDKGQLFMHVKAFEYMVSENKLPCNIKFLIEGEEEVGSSSLESFCVKNKEILKADVILVSDTSMLSLSNPSITTGLRGLAYFEVELTGQNRDLHSGLYGGSVKNPCMVLCSIIDKLIDQNGVITIPGFYDDILKLSAEERKQLNAAPFSEKDFFNSIGLKEGFGEKDYSVIERLGARPTCDVNGIWGGHTAEGAKTVLPAKAFAKISMRLVPNQTPARVVEQFKTYLNKIIPDGFTIKVEYLHGGTPYLLPFESKELDAAKKAIQKTFGKIPFPVRSGGSIPVISTFEKVLGIKSVLLGFGLETDAIHAPNENYPLANFYKGIETIPWFYHYYAF
ncbi:MAG: dipeptidase [Bacteroidota bacterium]|nr:MAG: dipeptidase [Bacteroidota bacterium]